MSRTAYPMDLTDHILYTNNCFGDGASLKGEADRVPLSQKDPNLFFTDNGRSFFDAYVARKTARSTRYRLHCYTPCGVNLDRLW